MFTSVAELLDEKNFVVTATDAAGNTTTRTVTYTSSPGGKERD